MNHEGKVLKKNILENTLHSSISHELLREPKAFQWLPMTSISHNSLLAKSPILLKEIEHYANRLEQDGFDSAIVVQQLAPYQYEVVLGYKLFFASNIAGKESIPAIVLTPQLSNKKLKQSLMEELQWNDLDDVETAKAYDLLLQAFNYTHDELASLLKVSRPVISNQLRILQLPQAIQQALQSKSLTKSQCHLLLRLSNQEEQLHLAKRIIDEQLTVRQIEALITVKPTISKTQQRQWTNLLQQNFSQKVSVDVSKQTISFSCSSDEDLSNLINHLLSKSSL